MAGGSVQSILGYTTLVKALQRTKSGIPNPFPEAMFKTSEDNRCLKDSGRYDQYTGQRKTARLNKYGSPARQSELKDIEQRDVKLLHTYEKISLEPDIYYYLRDTNSYMHDKSLQEVKRQVKEFKKKFENLRVAAVAQVLRGGKLYWNGDGSLLPTSSGATETHDFGLSANNQNQLNGIISASWATTTTNIELQLLNLNRTAIQDHGYELKLAFYGESVPSYLARNTTVQNFMSRNNVMGGEYLASGIIPQGLFGYTWIPAYNAFYEDADGTNQRLWDTDRVAFTPDVEDGDWWAMMEGSFHVPTTIDVQSSAEQTMNNLKMVYGQFGYSLVVHDPVCVNQYYGDTFIPLLKNPNVLYSADVAF